MAQIKDNNELKDSVKIKYTKDIKHLGVDCKKGDTRNVSKSIPELKVFKTFAEIVK